MPAEPHHVALFVADLDRSLHLFQDVIGLELIWRRDRVGGSKLAALMGLESVVVDLAYLAAPVGGVGVELVRLHEPSIESGPMDFGRPGSVTLSLSVENLDQLHRRLSENGYPPLCPCFSLRSPEGDAIRAFSLRTHEGAILELIEFQ